MTYHAAVWIDHQEAKIFHLTTQDVERSRIASSSNKLPVFPDLLQS